MLDDLRGDGEQVVFQEEGFEPFLVKGDSPAGKDYFPLDVGTGVYELTARPFDKNGDLQDGGIVRFEVRDANSEFNGPVNRRFLALDSTTGSLNGRVDELERPNAGQEQEIDDLFAAAAAASAVADRVDELERLNAGQEQEIDDLFARIEDLEANQLPLSGFYPIIVPFDAVANAETPMIQKCESGDIAVAGGVTGLDRLTGTHGHSHNHVHLLIPPATTFGADPGSTGVTELPIGTFLRSSEPIAEGDGIVATGGTAVGWKVAVVNPFGFDDGVTMFVTCADLTP